MDSPTNSELPELLNWLTGPERDELETLLTGYTPPLWTPLPGPQTLAYESDADVLGYGGSAGGGKSDFILGLAATKHLRALILRRQAVQLRAVIDRSRELFGHLEGARLNENTGTWRGLPGGRQVEMGGVANPGDEQKYRGRPHDLLAFDEADQFPEPVVRFLAGWLRTTTPGQRCRLVLCFNPPATAEGRWLLSFFGPWVDPTHPRPAAPGERRWYATLPDGAEVERPDGNPFEHAGEAITPKSRTFIPARVTDNPYLTATNYVATLQALPEPLRSQLLYGDMTAGLEDDPWQVIPTAWVKAAQARWTPEPPAGEPMAALGVDVARGGRDFTVIVPRHGPWFGRPQKFRGADTDDGPKAAALVLAAARGHEPLVNIDVIGVGASVYDFLKSACAQAHAGPVRPGQFHKRGLEIQPVNNAEATEARDRSRRFRLVNVRAASYWALREALDPEHGEGLALPPGPEVLADLTAPRYQVTASGIKVEPKEDISERIGRSPDVGDAVVLAHWADRRRKLAIFA
jgi:hypothetical protein